jgi:hypothetical protein
MRRTEELTLRYLDGSVDGAEREELSRLVDTDADARRLFLTMVEIEVVLRAGHPVDVTAQVMDRIFEDRTSRVVCGVMQQVTGIGTLPPRRAPASRWWLGGGALVAASLAAMFLAAGPLHTRARPPLAAPARPPEVAIAAAGDPPAPSPAPLVQLDFEAMDSVPFEGRLVTGDCARGSRRCVESDRSGEVGFAPAGPMLFAYGRNQVLSFDYLVDDKTRGLTVRAATASRPEASLSLPQLVHGRWAHAEIRLADMRDPRERALAAREPITRLVLSARGEARFRIDNLAVVAYPQENLLPTTSALLTSSR